MIQGTKVEFIINLRTAKALGIDVPPSATWTRRRGDRAKPTDQFVDQPIRFELAINCPTCGEHYSLASLRSHITL